MKTIIFIETSDVSVQYCARASKALGYEPLFICDINRYQGDTLLELKGNKYIHLDNTNDVASIIQVIKENKIEDIVGVLSFFDSRISVASKVAAHFNILGPDVQYVNYFSDKIKVSQLIPEFSPKNISFVLDDRIPKDKIKELFMSTQKLIIKPANSAGGVGVKVISNIDDIDKLDIILKRQLFSSNEWIIEAFLSGALISVEGYIQDGILTVLGISKRIKYENTEAINLFPYKLKGHQFERVCNALNLLIERSNFTHGYFHTEFIVNDNDINLIDSNFGRIGGATILEQVALYYDVEPEDVCRHIIELSLFGKAEDIYQYPTDKMTLGIWYGVKNETFIKKINCLISNNNKIFHHKIINELNFGMPFGVNNLSWVGLLCGERDCLIELLDDIYILDANDIKFKIYYGDIDLDKCYE